MQWTQEQLPIIHSNASKLLIWASAGSGKITRLVGTRNSTQPSDEKRGLNLHRAYQLKKPACSV